MEFGNESESGVGNAVVRDVDDDVGKEVNKEVIVNDKENETDKVEAVENFEKCEKGRGTSKRLNATAKEIQSQFTKLEKEYEDMKEAITNLTEAIITSGNKKSRGFERKSNSKLLS